MKTTVNKKLYEAMFLVDSAEAASEWKKIESTIKRILKRADAEIVLLKKWDDRRLAYEIGGKSKGAYILCYFRADGRKNHDIERGVQLSERIMRVLILRADAVDEKDLETEAPAMPAEKQEAAETAGERGRGKEVVTTEDSETAIDLTEADKESADIEEVEKKEEPEAGEEKGEGVAKESKESERT
ncbi:MAG: 30S ribosomal protein S6 [Planctomycetota bacterium]